MALDHNFGCKTTLNDVLDCVEIWRQKYAVLILQTLKDVFNDEEIEVPIEESTSDCDETVLSDWNMIRNDSTSTEMFDTYELEGYISVWESDCDGTRY